MSDRSAAEIFARFFERLAEQAMHPEPDVRQVVNDLAAHAWEDAKHYDFDWQQMGCDGALVELGLATRMREPSDDPNDIELDIDYHGPK